MSMIKGKLVRWIDDKGFGFIKPEQGGKDIFIHISALKGMSRPPITGDVIYYQPSIDASGKTRAVNARIKGVSQELTLTPLANPQKRHHPRPVLSSEQRYRKPTQYNKRYKKTNPLLFLMGIAAIFFIFNHFTKQKNTPAANKTTVFESQSSPQYECEGKVHCSQMSSYEEAVFYLQNCPGTKMDGDGDGIPCERQFY